jgi:hypothetical protein
VSVTLTEAGSHYYLADTVTTVVLSGLQDAEVITVHLPETTADGRYVEVILSNCSQTCAPAILAGELTWGEVVAGPLRFLYTKAHGWRAYETGSFA